MKIRLAMAAAMVLLVMMAAASMLPLSDSHADRVALARPEKAVQRAASVTVTTQPAAQPVPDRMQALEAFKFLQLRCGQ